MRKSLIDPHGSPASEPITWLDLIKIAKVEITSEDDLFPIKHALSPAISIGWRASSTGPQVVRLRFDHPVDIRRIYLHVVERAAERSQEIGIYAESSATGLREVRRQQFTFSPHGSTEEIEDFAVELASVSTLEVRIDPDRSQQPSQSQNFATLVALKLA